MSALDRSAGHVWWIGLVATAVLLTTAVAVRRNRMGAADTAGPWRFRLRTLLAAKSPPELQHLSTLRLASGQSLHVVSWEGRRLLLGCSEQAVRLLAESVDTPRATATAGPPPHKAQP